MLTLVPQDLKSKEEEYLLLEDTVRFLLEISEESVGNDLREDFNPIAIKWKQLFDVCYFIAFV